jgi:hypothetical protein
LAYYCGVLEKPRFLERMPSGGDCKKDDPL